MQRRDINAPTPPPVGAYTQVIEVSGAARTLYISGQVGVDATAQRAGRRRRAVPARVVEPRGAVARRGHDVRQHREDRRRS